MTYQLKITLNNTKPLVWRRILIEETATFGQLHDVIQTAFGWEEMHLHMFKTEDQVTIKPSYDELEGPFSTEVDEEEVQLLEVFRQENIKVRYTYDFGDNWEHDIILEKVLATESDQLLPICIAANGVAPEEDSLGMEELFEADWTEEELLDMINEELIFSQMLDEFDANDPAFEDWEELFDWVDPIKKLKPWNYLTDDQIIAIWVPSIQDYAYCSIMGNAEMHYGITCYIGKQGLLSLINTFTENRSYDELSIMLHHRALTLNLLDRDELEESEYELIKMVGKSYRGKNQWPSFHSLKPGYYPWELDKEEVGLLLEIYPELMNVLRRAKKDTNMIPAGVEEWFARTISDNGNWMDSTIHPMQRYEKAIEIAPVELEISELDLARVKKAFKKSSQEIELGILPFPEPVQNHPLERPFLPFMFLAMDKQTKMALHHDLIRVYDGVQIIQETFAQMVDQLGTIPSVIYMNDEKYANELKPVTDKLGIRVEVVPSLEEVEFFMQEMIGAMDAENGDNIPF